MRCERTDLEWSTIRPVLPAKSRGVPRLDDGTVLKAKGTQFVPAGRRLVLDLPGGGGFGDAGARATEAVERDVAEGYVAVTAGRKS